MYFYRKLKLFWMDNWGKILIVFFLVSMILFFVVMLQMLDPYHRLTMLATIPMYFLMSVVSAVAFVYLYSTVLMGRGFSRMRANVNVKSENVNVRFRDVIGLENAKKEAMEVVQLLKDHARLKSVGGKIIKGIVLKGPPGTGKTLLAKAIASEAGIPFMSLSGSDFVEVFVGVGASRVRQLFKKARLLAYTNGACMIFIDEIDAIGRTRRFSSFGSQENDSTLNQLLVEMDGLSDMHENVVVIGATNAHEGVLDQALMRPGRFDRQIYIDLPNLEERIDTFRYYLKKVKFDPDIDIGRLARRSVRKSPADIMNIVKEAALFATRDKRLKIEYKDFTAAIERLDLGMVHPLNMSRREMESVAFHETGHLMVLYYLHPTDDVFKASIIHRGGALGVVYHHPREESHISTRDKFIADIKTSLGGFIAERIKYGVTSSGVSSDFSHAMSLAHAMVWKLGMGTNGYIGNYDLIPEHQLSDDIKQQLNKETHVILNQCAKEVEAFLREEWVIVERFAQELMKRNELEYDDIHAIFAEHGKARDQVPVETVHPEDAPQDKNPPSPSV